MACCASGRKIQRASHLERPSWPSMSIWFAPSTSPSPSLSPSSYSSRHHDREESRKIGDLDASKVKGPEALASPGSHDGEILLVRQATKVRAFKWDAATRDWELVGDVTDAKNNVIDGVEYDQVINVTLDDGNRRLGYMNGGAYACCMLSCTSTIDCHLCCATENPYIAAQRFLLQNEDLPRDYEDQLVDFIIRNLERRESQTLTMGGGLGGRADPITGNSGWHPSAAAPAAAPAPAIRAPTTDPVRAQLLAVVSRVPTCARAYPPSRAEQDHSTRTDVLVLSATDCGTL